MTEPRILVVDDQPDMAAGMAIVLKRLSRDVTVACSGEEALEVLRDAPADLVIADIKMPGMDGVELLRRIMSSWPRTRVILCTGYGTIESAVAAMKLGALDYLTKPFDREELIRVVERALTELHNEAEIARLRAALSGSHCFRQMYGRNPRMLEIFDTIERIAPSSAPVLVHGESGTGKELVARAIHSASPRASNPFVAFNAGAVSEALAEAELFGARKGAYTGADRDRKGFFVEADGGTLFIDEIGHMPQSLQTKLLRALQEHEVTPVGTSRPVSVDVRVVSALNDDPMKLVSEGRLRKDLYYRLSVVRIAVPPMRERVEDVELLCNVFLARQADSSGQPAKQLSQRALRLLVSHAWPGNVRELQNVIERACLMTSSREIGPADIEFEREHGHGGGEEELAYDEAKRQALDRFQRRYVERLLDKTGGNVAAAARRANITRAALHRILNRLKMSVRDER